MNKEMTVSWRLFGKRYSELSSEQKKTVCRDCYKRYNDKHKEERYRSHSEWRKKNKSKSRGYWLKWTNKRWDTFLNHYGNACTCCGESNRSFLTIEHLDGKGKEHRSLLNSGSTARVINDIIRQGFPDTFTVLCMNCNWGKHRTGGVCPHVVAKAHKWLEEVRVIQKEIDESPR